MASLRIEAFGRVFYVEFAKVEQSPTTGPPDNVPQPMVTYADPTSEPLAMHPGGVEPWQLGGRVRA